MAVVGYPIGGDTISVTSGVVSRIEVTSYVHGSTELLGVQIDAAINSGNSGGLLLVMSGQFANCTVCWATVDSPLCWCNVLVVYASSGWQSCTLCHQH